MLPCVLMCRILQANVGSLYAAICELFEMYFLHTLRAFADMQIADIVSPTASSTQARDVAPPFAQIGGLVILSGPISRVGFTRRRQM